jgi:guanine deaminase
MARPTSHLPIAASPSVESPACSAHRGRILTFNSDPGAHDPPESYDYFDDGLMIIADGKISEVGPAEALLKKLPGDASIIDHGKRLLLPGFIDTHIHYPQTDVIASGGAQLLDWLEQYTFPEESKFADAAHAAEVSEFFLDELLRNGTTTAMVFCTVHRTSVDAFFTSASRRNLRMVAGKVLMDRNSPEYLRDTATSGERETRELIEQWHGHLRMGYAVTPRFAPTSSEAQLESAGRVVSDHPDVYIHSHLAENHAEIAWVKALYPTARSYLDVYDRHGLVRERAIYAHCIHLDDTDRSRMGQSGAAAAFCPTSNLYLGSGLFKISAADKAGLRFSIATDVGGGTTFNMLRTMSEAYKVGQLTQDRLSPLRAFYLGTLGSARCLGLDHRIGRFTPGAEADFVVLDFEATPLLARRSASSRTLPEQLLVLMTLGDDRAIESTYILGKRAHMRVAQSGPMLDNHS